jgi:hypothetical protein
LDISTLDLLSSVTPVEKRLSLKPGFPLGIIARIVATSFDNAPNHGMQPTPPRRFAAHWRG